jgi:hypothetical protein
LVIHVHIYSICKSVLHPRSMSISWDNANCSEWRWSSWCCHTLSHLNAHVLWLELRCLHNITTYYFYLIFVTYAYNTFNVHVLLYGTNNITYRKFIKLEGKKNREK